ncbi:ABC transporter ATP-binding protein [Corynebacterium glutamicum]|uniref:Nitrate/sulfonate/bicarbonate ABC transporter ATP-binding protein n=1 Tax=Corynebacterium glutamicum TaxID=1718 RepID=A0AB36I9S0_CORGT|nr:ABC transporter ATP-binding protein [Corynebacterium glutamicum]ALZ99221.1 nitrate/sulfonate/bicarbonate ABC transporter ATP-binding protein [Corynebacterium glutamicum]NII88428.1 NitT/TauT family transport system ATP-binding protein [Corynebacterium glutamicum]OKX76207.1 nitrate/sulfonate/bicarbonate ABC transporter ATP-binding protein [Corynebacterium glutamicum]OKX78113.1 nitrate/sulfonate/bicarbonate ABC transporter ATP-binding protein [Corynebacterium glutamicum]TWS46001.1 nitrate ABC 
MSNTSAISVKNVGVTFHSRDGAENRVLKGVDFDVKPGEFVSIVGQSGSGKTTLLKTISGLQQATEGEVLVNGKPIAEQVEDIAMVFQAPVLLPWRNNVNNVLLPLEFRGTKTRESTDRAYQLLEMAGLKGKETRYSYELSGGMQQRVAICRALVSNPQLLLMDEPFGALDAMTRDSMNFELQKIWMREKCSVLFVTHSISEAVWLGDRVIIVGDRPGHIVADIKIDIPRPRAKEHRFSEVFSDYVAEIESFIGVTTGIS